MSLAAEASQDGCMVTNSKNDGSGLTHSLRDVSVAELEDSMSDICLAKEAPFRNSSGTDSQSSFSEGTQTFQISSEAVKQKRQELSDQSELPANNGEDWERDMFTDSEMEGSAAVMKKLLDHSTKEMDNIQTSDLGSDDFEFGSPLLGHQHAQNVPLSHAEVTDENNLNRQTGTSNISSNSETQNINDGDQTFGANNAPERERSAIHVGLEKVTSKSFEKAASPVEGISNVATDNKTCMNYVSGQDGSSQICRTFGVGSRAHITLGVSFEEQAVQTGFDQMGIVQCESECYDDYIMIDGAKVRDYGQCRWAVYFDKPLILDALFTGCY